MAAYTNVDKAETLEREQAYSLNVTATKNLFEAVCEKQKKFIYISTGFVFNGNNPPYFEDSKPDPISYYGLTKYQGEQVIENNAMIVRIEYPYRKHFLKKNDFVRTIVQLLQKGQHVTMVNDSIFTPTFIDDISKGLGFLFQNYSNQIFHLVGSKSYSPYEAGLSIARAFNLDSSLISPISYDEYFKDKAKRPRQSDVRSKKNNFQTMKTLEQGLEEIS
jgi:dTDP-4-dehydrorhamnose reductase